MASEARRLDETTADDLFLFAMDVGHMKAKIKSLQHLAHITIGLSLRLDKRKWAKVLRAGGLAPCTAGE